MNEKKVMVELCRRNGGGCDASVLDSRTVTMAEALKLLARRTSDGTFWRVWRDKTGNGLSPFFVQ